MSNLPFKQFRTTIDETVSRVNENVVKKMKVGKDNKFSAEIKKQGSNYIATVDGEKLDDFKSEKAAEKGIKDFVKLMDL